jgi:hypothetical protein
MKTTSRFVTEKIAHRFVLGGEVRELTPITQGHINETWLSIVESDSQIVRYIHQRINPSVFPDGSLVMRNIQRITDHLRGCAAYPYQILELVSSEDGSFWICDEEGGWWRTYRYIEDSVAYDSCPSEAVARGAGLAFGTFLREIAPLPASSVVTPLIGFQDLAGRFRALAEVLQDSTDARRDDSAAEIEFALRNEERVAVVSGLMKGSNSLRITHGDTKLNNVLFRRGTASALCVIDLDTVMPGSPLYDFGDFSRQIGVASREDGPADIPMPMRWDFLREATSGFLEGIGENYLSRTETEALCLMPGLISLTLGVRFLTDYLGGDNYFRVQYEGQNLSRARCQFAIAQAYFQEKDQLEEIIGSSVANWGSQAPRF